MVQATFTKFSPYVKIYDTEVEAERAFWEIQQLGVVVESPLSITKTWFPIHQIDYARIIKQP
jgi:hypothetical protein